MHLLVEKHWKPFIKEEGQRDGSKFERLSLLLLQHCFPPHMGYSELQWEPRTHPQGARDFVAKIGQREIWVECKNYSATISRNTFSSTFAMAPLAAVDEIILFSYSSINEPSLQYLWEYQLATNKRVRAYHNESLESLILSCDHALKKHFPGFLEEYPDVDIRLSRLCQADGLLLYIAATTTIDADTTSNIRIDNEPPEFGTGVIEVNHSSIVAVDVFMENRDPLYTQHGNLTLHIPAMPFLAVEDTFTKTVSIAVEIGPASFHRQRFHLIATAPFQGKAQLSVEFVPEAPSQKKQRARLPYHLSWANELSAPLVGASRISFRDSLETFTSGKNLPLFCLIHGYSGVGKSHMLDESYQSLIRCGRRIHRLDGQAMGTPSFRGFLLALFEKVVPAPLFHGHRQIASAEYGSYWNEAYASLLEKVQNEETPLEEEDFTPEECSIAASFLTDVLRGTRQQRAILIDNLQSFPDLVVAFLEIFADKQAADPFAPLFIVVINTETAPTSSPARRFLTSIERRKGDQSRFKTLHLEEFSTAEYTQFINEFFAETKEKKTFTRIYDDWSNELFNKIMRRPLFLKQLLHYLLDIKNEGHQVIEWDLSTGLLRVVDPEALGQIIRDSYLPASLEALMEVRWSMIIEQMADGAADEAKEGYETPARELEYFGLFILLGAIKEKHIAALGFAPEWLQAWKERGLIKKEGGQFVFYHNLIRAFFLKQVFENNTGQAWVIAAYHLAYDLLTHPNLKKNYPVAYLTAALFLNRINDADVQLAQKEIARWGDTHGLKLFLDGMVDYIREGCEQAPTPFQIQLWKSVAERRRHNVYAPDGVALYAEGVKMLQESLEVEALSSQELDIYVSFMISAANAHLTGHDDKKNVEFLEEAASWADRATLSAPTLSFLHNRLCVAYKSMNNPEKALLSGAQALKAARRCEGRKKQLRLIFGHVDMANVFQNGHALGDRSHIAVRGEEKLHLAVRQWKRAIRLFEADKRVVREDFEILPIVKLYRTQCQMLNGEYEVALKTLEEGLEDCRRLNAAFFEVKLTILKGVIFLLQPSLIANRELEDIALKAVSLAASHGIDRYGWTASYLQAKVALAKSNARFAEEAYANACTLLNAAASHEAVEEYHYHFFDDYVLTARNLGWTIPQDVMLQIKSPLLRQRMEGVLALSDDRFQRAFTLYRPTARFHMPPKSAFHQLQNMNLPSP